MVSYFLYVWSTTKVSLKDTLCHFSHYGWIMFLLLNPNYSLSQCLIWSGTWNSTILLSEVTDFNFSLQLLFFKCWPTFYKYRYLSWPVVGVLFLMVHDRNSHNKRKPVFCIEDSTEDKITLFIYSPYTLPIFIGFQF